MRGARHRRLRTQWWPTLLPLGMILASDYKFRSRDVSAAVGGGIDTTVLLEIGVYGLCALYLYRRFGLRAPRRAAPAVLILAWLFAAYCALSVLWTPFPPFAAVRASQLLVTAIVCHVIATRARRDDLYRLAHVFVGLVVVSVAFGVAVPLKRTPNTQDRFNWLYVHPVTAGMFLGVALLLCLAFLLPNGLPRRFPWPVYAGSAGVTAAALVATGTRGAAVGILAGVAAFLLTARGTRGRVEVIMVGTPILVLLPLLFGDKLLEFATRGETVEQLESLNSRTDLWTFAYQAVLNRPVFGNGMSSARGLFLDALGLGGGHNIFVNVLVEGGLVGGVIFCLLIVVVLTVNLAYTRVREVRVEAALLLGLMTFLVIDGLTADQMAGAANVASIWMFLIVAWTCVITRKPVRRDERHDTRETGVVSPVP
ncbi:hypothetical protein GT755_26180 [Herbidospora sp. NEAU-GS84]|uniref:O-antigen ligase-related domain-containing protein n=1 Tax=Herbidospora solisilvae TaxID=2696284 RepID=A0A7C9JY06_9ACTN|nr:O-antigen ligase family protein [Herbidospora solisilvae]NAS25159.1 hypothetical protein [Herbidospora solisilvae]